MTLLLRRVSTGLFPLCLDEQSSRKTEPLHYIDIIMTTTASQITSLTVVYSTVYSDADQRKHQSSASLAFVWGIHRDRWIPRTKGQLRGKCFHLMTSSCFHWAHDDVMAWKCCPRYWPFVRGIHPSKVNSPHKGPETRISNVFFYVPLNKALNKQWSCRWFGCHDAHMSSLQCRRTSYQKIWKKHETARICHNVLISLKLLNTGKTLQP